MKSIQELQTIATQVRRDILRMTTAAKSGHPGGSLGTADWMTAMQFNILDQDPAKFTMDGNGQDMLFVSQGHITMKGDKGTGSVTDEHENALSVTCTRKGEELICYDQNSRQYIFRL